MVISFFIRNHMDFKKEKIAELIYERDLEEKETLTGGVSKRVKPYDGLSYVQKLSYRLRAVKWWDVFLALEKENKDVLICFYVLGFEVIIKRSRRFRTIKYVTKNPPLGIDKKPKTKYI